MHERYLILVRDSNLELNSIYSMKCEALKHDSTDYLNEFLLRVLFEAVKIARIISQYIAIVDHVLTCTLTEVTSRHVDSLINAYMYVILHTAIIIIRAANLEKNRLAHRDRVDNKRAT